jgi:uncharacterized protein YndB with AHSA1/START domain
MKISTTIDIYSQPEEVFSWINEPNKAMRWQKGVKSGEIIKETPDKIGTTFKEVMEENGESLIMYGEIIDYIPNELISFQLESKIHKVHVNYSVKGEMGKSTVLIKSTISWKFPMNIICLIIGFKIKVKILDQTKSELSELKRLCETKMNKM